LVAAVIVPLTDTAVVGGAAAGELPPPPPQPDKKIIRTASQVVILFIRENMKIFCCFLMCVKRERVGFKPEVRLQLRL
jgi:hypothetical protein